MKMLCRSRGAVDIQLANVLLLLVTLIISSTTSLPIIHSALSVIKQVELGKEISFNCTNLSTEHQQLVWYDGTSLLLNSSQLHHGIAVTRMASNNVIITIHNITSYHYGNYKCFDDDTGKLQKLVTLIPSTADLIKEKLIEERNSTIISCDEGLQMVKVDKKFDHSTITDNLVVFNVPAKDQGKYLCLEDDGYPSVIYYVQVSGYRPLIIISPRNISHWEQLPPYQNLDCLVTGAPGPITINWYHGNTSEPISSFGRIHVEQLNNASVFDGGLRLVLNSSFPDRDSGTYICVAMSNWEQVEQSININFTIHRDSRVYIAYWPDSVTAVGGSNVTITCYAVGVGIELGVKFEFTKGNDTLLIQPCQSGWNHVACSSLSLNNVTPSDNGKYNCQIYHLLNHDQRASTLKVYEDPLHIVSFTSNKSAGNKSVALVCQVVLHKAFAHRLADIRVMIEWQSFHNQTVTPQQAFGANIITVSVAVKESGFYKCIATIDGVSKSRSIHVELPITNGDDKDELKTILLGGLGLVAFLCVMTCSLLFVICCHCPHKSPNSMYSNMVSKTKIGARYSTNSSSTVDFVFSQSMSKSNLLPSSSSSLSEWSISYDRLEFGCSLGSGAFGSVRKAYLMTDVGRKTPVAVKTLQCGGDEVNSKEAFEKEVMILYHVGTHPHIIGLFGVCTQEDKYLLVMELACRGNLLDYLYKKRTDELQPLSVYEVLKFAKQISSGMEHLASQQCVHCDLAARNVLITEDFTLKISDFGLARKLYSGIYVKDKSKKVRLPVRWMAPESMTELKFSSQSDIWSYGVLLWEMYQLGAVPYHNVSIYKLCSLLQQGLRLEKPHNCSQYHYELMLSYWHDDPSCRPSFTKISEDLSNLIEASSSAVYINWNDDINDCYSDCSMDCSDISITSTVEGDIEDVCPVHGKSSDTSSHPAVSNHLVIKRNFAPVKRQDSGLPDSPSDPFACKKDLRYKEMNKNLLDETDV